MRSDTDASSPDVQGYPTKKDSNTDTGHGSKCSGVARLIDPRIRVEREEESKAGCLR